MRPLSDTEPTADQSPDEAGSLLQRAERLYDRARADPARSLGQAVRLVAAAQADRDDEALVVALRAQAWCTRALLDGAEARHLLDRAARLARRAHLPQRLGQVLVDQASVDVELGRARAAQLDLERARLLLGGQIPPELEQQTAMLHQNAGRLGEAAPIYRRLLHDPRTPAQIVARAANNLSVIESQRGRHGTALALIVRARSLSDHAGPGLAAYFALSHGWVTAHAGRLAESLALYDDAERMFLDAGLPLGEHLAEFADVMLDLRLLPEAREAADRALAEFTTAGMALMEAEAALRVARVALVSGRHAEADRVAQRAAASFRRQHRAEWAARAETVSIEARLAAGSVAVHDLRRVARVARVLERAGMVADAVGAHLCAGRSAALLERVSRALASWDRAHELARGAPLLTRLQGRIAAALAAELRGDQAGTLRQCRDGLAHLDTHRDGLVSTELRVLASAHGAELGRLGVRTLMGTSSVHHVLRWMERGRAAALLNLQQVHVEDFAAEFDQLRTMRHDLLAPGAASPALVARHGALEQRLRRLTWEPAAGEDATRAGLSAVDVRRLLGDRVLVEYGIAQDEIFAVVATNDRMTLARNLARREVVEAHAERLGFALRGLTRPTSPRTVTTHVDTVHARVRALQDLLVAPLEIASRREAVVVPEGVLQTLPWSALLSGPVSVSQSATFWALTRERRPPPSGGVALISGPGLPGALAEVERLADLHPAPVALAPPASTVGQVCESLEQVAVAHFACHGRIRTDNPMFSGLELTDGPLTVQELELRNLAPHLVVLAACEVGTGVSFAGGEVLGFVSALIARGTAGVVASTHLMPDRETGDLMVRLHERLAVGETAVSAVHGARADLDRERPVDLVNWCGLTAFGAA